MANLNATYIEASSITPVTKSTWGTCYSYTVNNSIPQYLFEEASSGKAAALYQLCGYAGTTAYYKVIQPAINTIVIYAKNDTTTIKVYRHNDATWQ